MTKAARFSEAAYTEHDKTGRLCQTGHHHCAKDVRLIMWGL
jgi:hypothetical protein